MSLSEKLHALADDVRALANEAGDAEVKAAFPPADRAQGESTTTETSAEGERAFGPQDPAPPVDPSTPAPSGEPPEPSSAATETPSTEGL